jgi:hypothetical protein
MLQRRRLRKKLFKTSKIIQGGYLLSLPYATYTQPGGRSRQSFLAEQSKPKNKTSSTICLYHIDMGDLILSGGGREYDRKRPWGKKKI